MKPLVHSFLLELALLGKRGLLELSCGITKNALGKFLKNDIKFWTFTYLYGTHPKSSYKYCAVVKPAKWYVTFC